MTSDSHVFIWRKVLEHSRFIDLPRESYDVYIKLVDHNVWFWITNYINDKQWLINTFKTFILLRELFSRFDVYSNFYIRFFSFLLCCWFSVSKHVSHLRYISSSISLTSFFWNVTNRLWNFFQKCQVFPIKQHEI